MSILIDQQGKPAQFGKRCSICIDYLRGKFSFFDDHNNVLKFVANENDSTPDSHFLIGSIDKSSGLNIAIMLAATHGCRLKKVTETENCEAFQLLQVCED